MSREQYDIRWKDYYELLGVRQDASVETIRRMWRRLSQVYHPDVAGDASVDPERMPEINEAYEVLSDSARRARYDDIYRARNNGSYRSHSDNSSANSESYSSYQDDYADEGWYADWEYEQNSGYYDGGQSQQSRPYEDESYEEPVQILSFSFLRLLLSRLLDKISPSADESQRIIPWPSWAMQRLFLIVSIPLGLLLLGVAIAYASWPSAIFAILLSAAAVYAGTATRWMRNTGIAPLPARIAGGASVIVSGVSLAVGVAYIVFVVVFIILALIFAAALFKAIMAEAFRRYLR